MSRTGIITASYIGLVLAVAEGILMPLTVSRANTEVLSLVVLLLGTLAAGIAGRVIVGMRPAHRYFRGGVPILAAIAGFVIESGVSNIVIAVLNNQFGPIPPLRSAVIVELVIGGVIYLLTATIYGFAGARQGIAVENRTQLLLLLLLAVIPFVNVLGMIGFVITAYRRKLAVDDDEPASSPSDAETTTTAD